MTARKTIWKYPLSLTDLQEVKMPGNAIILTARLQGSQICVWAIVEPDQPLRVRTIEIHGTGNPMEPEGMLWSRHYIGTVQIGKVDQERAFTVFVWHVFERA